MRDELGLTGKISLIRISKEYAKWKIHTIYTSLVSYFHYAYLLQDIYQVPNFHFLAIQHCTYFSNMVI